MQPNFVLITCHDLGKHLGCYGQSTVPSPNLDELASQGVLMDNAFCTAPQCSPSRSALHTGRHAHSNGVMGLTHNPFNWRLHANERHLAHLLYKAGYSTALIGHQHLTSQPLELGYQMVVPEAPALETAKNVRAFFKEVRKSERPFYLEVGFVETHRPYDWGGAVPDDSRGVSVPPYLPDTTEAHNELAALQGAIRHLDEAVGVIMQALKETELEESTWLIFTVDHGLAMPRAKGTLYDTGLEVALLMRWPVAGLSGGKRFSDIVSHVDLLPTLLEGAGLPLPADLQGHSYWALLQDAEYKSNQAVFGEKTYHTAYEPMRAVRTATHKLVVNFEVGPKVDVPDDTRYSKIYPLMLDMMTGQRPYMELYDLRTDPYETTNLSDHPDHSEVQNALASILLNWMIETQDPLLAGPIPSPFYQVSLDRLYDAANKSGAVEASPLEYPGTRQISEETKDGE
jgi:N-sulfoglucosamine sulfohydrolase